MKNLTAILLFAALAACGSKEPIQPVDNTPQTPPGRWGHAMAYDVAHSKVVMFGGSTNSAFFDDTWTWDGTAWTQITVQGAKPTPRDQQIMAWDPVGQRVLLYGGRTSLAGGATNRELWSWNGSAWTLLSSDGPAMSGHETGGWDVARNAFVIVTMQGDGPGGTIAETWEWSGTWNRRTATTPSARTLPSRGAGAMSAGALFVLAGNLENNTSDEWVWNGTAWTVGAAGLRIAPPALVAATSDAGQMLILDETTSPDGTTWIDRNSQLSKQNIANPTRRFAAYMVYDAARHSVVLFGGQDPTGRFLDETWLWTPTGWTKK